jgi:Na+/melibiose symporter-like transporter
MGVFLSGMLLGLVSFPEKADPATISAELVHRLAVMYVLSIGAMVILAIVAVGFYPITREKHQAILSALSARRAQRS